MELKKPQLDSLDIQQERIVYAPRGPIVVYAGAGSGKTRTLTNRIVRLVFEKQIAINNFLAITYTTKAADELRIRLNNKLNSIESYSLVNVSTFHAAAYRQLKYFWPKFAKHISWNLLTSKFRLLNQISQKEKLYYSSEIIKDIGNEISWAKANLYSPDQYEKAAKTAARRLDIDLSKCADFYEQYEKLKIGTDKKLLDFDDLLSSMVAILEDNEELAFEFRKKYQTFLVDEFQDITPLQYKLLLTWLGKRKDILIVGDFNQTIFSFAGANIKYLLDFSNNFPDTKTFFLNLNYRSTPEIVAWANKLTQVKEKSKKISSFELISVRSSGVSPKITRYSSNDSEAENIISQIKLLTKNGVSPHDIAILYRINSLSEVFELELFRNNLSYQVLGQKKFFHRAEIQQLRTQLLQIKNPDTAINLAELKFVFTNLGFDENKFPKGTAALNRWNNLNTLYKNMVKLVMNNTAITSSSLLEYLEKQQKNPESLTETHAIQLTSFHSAKGLEWEYVFLVSVNEGILPYYREYKINKFDLQTEQNLFYVGITRAKTYLHISYYNEPSRFLNNFF